MEEEEEIKVIVTYQEPGERGEKGDIGISAYETAVTNGFVGTQPQWIASLKGLKGDTGLSAYSAAVLGGFVGTQSEWIASIKGEKGDKGDTADGTVNAVIGEAPASYATVANISIAGTYPLYSGLVVTTSDLSGSLVQFRKTGGTWIKYVSGPFVIPNKTVTEDKTTFINRINSKNRFNPTDPDVTGESYYVKAADGTITLQTASNTHYRSTGYIAVTPGETIYLSYKDQIAFYDSAKVFVPGSGNSTVNASGAAVVVPAGAAYVRATILDSTTFNVFQVESGSQKTAYVPYTVDLVLKTIAGDTILANGLTEVGKASVLGSVLASSTITQLSTAVSALGYVDPLNNTYSPVVLNDADVVSTGAYFSAKAHRSWLKGIAKKRFNAIKIPIARDYKTNTYFTGSITVKVFLGSIAITKVIPFADLAYYNALPANSPASAFDYTIILDAPLFINVDDIMFIGWEADVSTDLIGAIFKFNTASNATEFTQNYTNWSNTSGFVKDISSAPATSVRGGYYYRVGLGVVASSTVKPTLDVIFPPKIYTVANNVNPALRDNLRNSAAPLYLDHGLTSFSSEPNIKFEESGNDRVLFMSPIQVADGGSPDAVAINYNVNNAIVRKETRAIKIIGDYADKTVNIQHISTLSDVGKNVLDTVLSIGDSITFGESAFWPGEGGTTPIIKNYSLLIKVLMEKDRIDNGSIAGQYESVIVGTFKRTLSFDYAGSTRTVTACHEGRQGWTIDDYLSSKSGNKFWDTTNSRFSIKWYLDKYRTMTDAGVRLSNSDPAKGTLVTDTSAYDVCMPKHINIMLGANGSDTAAQFVVKLNTLIAAIKADYANNGWGVVNIYYTLLDSAGTYFPSRYPKFGKNIAFWNNSDASDPQRGKHERMRSIIKEWLTTKLAVDTEEADRVFFNPAYFTMPTAESACIRDLSLCPGSSDYLKSNQTIYEGYRWAPYVHLNPNAHGSAAYSLQSIIKYVKSL